MKKGICRSAVAVALAAAVAWSGLGFLNPPISLKAEETNFLTDGDFGDDDNDNLWEGNWNFSEETWSVVYENGIAYDAYAANNTASGLGISYQQAGTVALSQTLASLEAGGYTLSGYIKDSKGKTGTVQAYYGAEQAAESISITSEFQQFSFSFTLEEAQTDYQVGFFITSEPEAWICLDTVTLTKNASADAHKTQALAALDKVLTECGTLLETDYNPYTWAVFKQALEAAKTVREDSLHQTTEEILAAQTALTAAKENLWAASVVYLDNMENGMDTGWDVTWSNTAATSQMEQGAGNNTTRVWNLWSETAQTVTISRTVTGLAAGTYKASLDTAGENALGTIKIMDGERAVSADMTLAGWNTYTPAETGGLTVAENASVVLMLSVDLAANGYIKMDNITLEAVSEADITAEKLEKRAALEELLEVCRTLPENAYQAESFAVFQKTLAEAETVYQTACVDLHAVTSEQMREMLLKLTAARDALVPAELVHAEIFVDKLDLPEDFIKGVDISSYIAEKQSGVVYHDFSGNVLDDAGFFQLLKESGVNWVRIRVWNQPYDEAGHGYGGGNNDIEKAKLLGRLATDAGLRVLIDFHYSDFWADPAMQDAPKAWKGLGIEEKASAVYTYTLESLQALHTAGVDVGMVQIGNETNNGICGESTADWSGMARIFGAGSAAVRAYEESVYGIDTPDGSRVLAALHFTEPNTGIQAAIAEKLNTYGVDYDVFATSYYPFWHGTLENLNAVLRDIAVTYGKKVMVAETSYAYTFEDGDGHENNVRADKADALTLDYNISMQGQADALGNIMRTISRTTNGIGMFYWEPAWIPVQKYDAAADNAAAILAANQAKWEQYGSGWAASYSAEYDPENAGRYYGGSSWDNQALFDHNGYPQDVLRVFRYVETGATTEVRADVIQTSSATFEAGEAIVLPETVSAINNDGTKAEIPVAWNADEVEAISGFGAYTITGTAGGLTAICNVEVLPKNLLVNGGFEDGIGKGNGWEIAYGSSNTSLLKVDNKDIKRGSNALKFDAWSETISGITLTQTVAGLSSGVYGCYLNVEGAGEAGTYRIAITGSNGQKAQTDTAALLGWMSWDMAQVEGIEVSEGGSATVTIEIKTEALETWGTIDEVYLYRIGDLPPEGSETPEGDLPPEGSETPEGNLPPEGSETPEEDLPPEGSETPEENLPPEGSETPEEDLPPEEDGNKDEATGGSITSESRVEAGAPETGLLNSIEELQRAVLDIEDFAKIASGAHANIYLEVSNGNERVSQTDKMLIKNVLGEYKVGLYLDIALYKEIGTEGAKKVSETNGDIRIRLKIPEELINKDAAKTRVYRIIRIHNGAASVLEGRYEKGWLVFDTDAFSTYALVYMDISSPVDGIVAGAGKDYSGVNTMLAGTKEKSPQTGEPMLPGAVLALLIAGAALGLCACGTYKKDK